MAKNSASDVANQVAQTGKASPFAQIAQDLGLELNYTNEVFDQLVDDILLTMRGRSPELDAKIKQAWIERHTKNGRPPIYVNGGPDISGTMLVGPPGHGKTSVNRAAARVAAELVGLRFLDNPDDTVKVTENDFVFLSLEFAGVNSALQIKGIPYKKKMEMEGLAKERAIENGTSLEVEYLSFLKDYSLASLSQAGGGFLLMDDLLNATPEMINVALPLTEEKRFAGTHLGSHVYVGATGNLGARDGTKTSSMTAALSGRMRVLMVRDNADDVVKRARAIFNGPGEMGQFGSMYFDVFVERYGQEITEDLPESSERMGGYGSPRTLMKAMHAHFYELARVGGRDYANETLDRFAVNAGAFLGPRLSQKLEAFLNSAFQFADPAASLVIRKGEIHPAFEKHLEAPTTNEAEDFFHQLVSAMADYAAMEIEKGMTNKPEAEKYAAFKKVSENFAKGIALIDGAPYGMGIELFRERVVARNSFLCLQQGALAESTPVDRLSFSDKAFEILADALLADCPANKRADLDPILSEAGQYITTLNVGAPRAKSVEAPVEALTAGPAPTAPAKTRRGISPSA